MSATISAWLVAFAGYLLFAGTPSASELVTSAVLASAAVAWMWAIRHCARGHFAFSVIHVQVWLKTLGAAVPASARAGVVLARTAACGGSPGRALEVPFLRGDERAPEECARRASALLAASLAPDRFVVRAEPQRERVLIHAILAPRERDPRWLT